MQIIFCLIAGAKVTYSAPQYTSACGVGWTFPLTLVIQMPNAKYLPICGGMPAPALSSDPVSLTSVLAVETYLAGTPFASQSISDLGGGSVNYVYRVHLLSPFENSQTIVLKHAQPFVKLIAGLAWELERQVRAI